MCEMYQAIESLCAQRGIRPGKLCAELGISRGVLSDLKSGRTRRLSAENVSKIAAYFGVSADALLSGGTEPALTPADRRDIARELESMMAHLDIAGDLMFDGDPMSDEARRSIRSALQLGLEAAKLKNKEVYTPKKYR